MLLASKYEEIYAPAVDEFVYISDNTYTREQVRASFPSRARNQENSRLSVPALLGVEDGDQSARLPGLPFVGDHILHFHAALLEGSGRRHQNKAPRELPGGAQPPGVRDAQV